ncbi:hypothetical protein [Ekhidna sp.]
MKNVLMILIAVAFGGKQKVTINALDSVELTYEEFANYDVKLSNSSGKGIDVSVIDPSTKKQVSGFGLGPLGKATLSVRDGHILKLKNNSMKDVSLSITFVEKRKVAYSGEQRVNFTLRNTSSRSIPLVIPDVMNPNLSPLSNSGVSLKMGQKIYYKKGLKKILILTVDESIKTGDKIDIAKLVKGLND